MAPRGEAAEFWPRTRSSDEDIVAKSLIVLVLLGGRSRSLFGSTVGSPGIKPKMLHQAYKHMISRSFSADRTQRSTIEVMRDEKALTGCQTAVVKLVPAAPQAAGAGEE